MASDLVPRSTSEFLIYKTEDGNTQVQVRVDCDAILLSRNQMAELFQRDKSVIVRHISNISMNVNCGKEQLLQNLQQLPLRLFATHYSNPWANS